MAARGHLATTPAAVADELLATVRQLATELHPRRGAQGLTLDSALDRDFGLDSLDRTELLLRIEREFDARLPDGVLYAAETPRDLLGPLLAASRQAPQEAQAPVLLTGAAVGPPERARTLLEVLEWHVEAHPERRHVVFCEDGEEPLTYAGLLVGASKVALGLKERGLAPGQSVALMLPTGQAYFHCFMGILLAGGVPVPVYPPFRPSQLEDHLRRQAGILSNALAAFMITTPEVMPLARLLRGLVPGLREVATPQQLSGVGGIALPLFSRSDELALLQYTSGSTGQPKGVMLTHANLLANIRALGQAAAVRSEDVFVSWLPLYHDMGLIGAWLGSLYFAMPLVLMSPLAFLARPERWLRAIHRYRGTLSAAPNFAYELCVRKLADEDLAGLELGAWRLAVNGAEPVSPATVTRFCDRFAPYGFRREAMTPVYGLAESSVGLTFPSPGRGAVIDRVQREALLRDGLATPAKEDDPSALRFVACGRPLPGHRIRIVDARGRELGEREVGRLEFKGPSATAGYFRNPEQTARLFRGEWLESGDLAYTALGEVYLTSRVKDLIIRGGRNIPPYELEEAIGEIEGIRRGGVAVFGSADPESGTERLVVMAETREPRVAPDEALKARIVDVTLDLLAMPPDDVALVPPRTVLKTSSGKIRRAACRDRYEQGDLGAAAPAPWRQWLRLEAAGLVPRLRRASSDFASGLYSLYAWGVFGLVAVPAWIMIALAPGSSRRCLRVASRLLLRLTGIPLVVRGLEHLEGCGPCVLVANHASYLDGLALEACLPVAPRYVAHARFRARFFARLFLQRIGAIFVAAKGQARGLEETEEAARTLRLGEPVCFFPEGTFIRTPGLQPFRMGAFTAAAETGCAVVPIALRGTRHILRAHSRFLRRGGILVTIGPPIRPKGQGWAAALALRDAAYAEILRDCGESAIPEPGA
ncbi:MAG TPA: AMP-binding protein [Pantanalinema sp.]